MQRFFAAIGKLAVVAGVIYIIAYLTGPPVSFFVAVRRGELQTVEELLRRGHKVNMRDEQGNTPLHIAARGHLDSDPTAEGWASKSGYVRMASLLIEHDADVNAKNKKGETPLDVAQSLAMIDFLISCGANPSSDKVTLARAILYDDPEMVATRLTPSRLAEFNRYMAGFNATPLRIALANHRSRAAECLISRGANVNEGVPTPLHVAAGSRDLRMVELLISKGAKPNSRDGYGASPLLATLMYRQIRDQNYGSPRLLEDGWRDPHNADDDAAAADIVKYLVSHGANPNDDSCPEHGHEYDTALAWARTNHNDDLVRWLKAHGAKK